MFTGKNIWFTCPSCDKKLVVDADAAGMRADCPECGKRIPIPERSTAWPNGLKTFGLVAAQVVLIGMALVIGWQLAGRPASESTLETLVVAVAPAQETPLTNNRTGDVEQGSASTAVENTVLLDEHVELQGRYNRMIEWMLDNYRGKYPLPERMVEHLRISPMTDENDVHPDLVEILRMTDHEKEMVRDIFGYVRESFRSAELERARVTDEQPDRITFMIPHFPEVGQELKEDLYLALESTLGAPRFDRLVDVSGQALRERFHYYGEASRTLTFEIVQPKKPGDHPPYVLIRDGWVVPDGESVRLTKITETAVSQTLPSAYREYADWLPETLLKHTATP